MIATTAAPETLLHVGALRLLGGLVGIPAAVDFQIDPVGASGAVGVMRCLNRLEIAPLPGDEVAMAIELVVVAPVAFWPSFTMDVGDSLAEQLQILHPEDAAVVAIVSQQGEDRPTANLYAPLVVNRRTGVGCQVVPSRPPGGGGYSTAEVLPLQVR